MTTPSSGDELIQQLQTEQYAEQSGHRPHAEVDAGIGVAVSLALGRLVASQLYSVSAYAPLTLVSVSMFLIAVAALACYLPPDARRR